MPFIHSKVSVQTTVKQRELLKTMLGRAIALIPGKSENWLMVELNDGCDLYFQGSNDLPIAFIEVKLFGNARKEEYEKLTAEITKIYEKELSIQPDHIYVKYEEVSDWGWNGRNF